MLDILDTLASMEWVRYFGTGSVSNGIYYAVFIPLSLRWRERCVSCSVIAFVPFLVVDFLLQSKYAFSQAHTDEPLARIALFSLKDAAFFAMNIALLHALTRRMPDRPIFSQIIVTPPQSIISYACTHLIFWWP